MLVLDKTSELVLVISIVLSFSVVCRALASGASFSTADTCFVSDFSRISSSSLAYDVSTTLDPFSDGFNRMLDYFSINVDVGRCGGVHASPNAAKTYSNHWVRDASICMSSLISLLQFSSWMKARRPTYGFAPIIPANPIPSCSQFAPAVSHIQTESVQILVDYVGFVSVIQARPPIHNAIDVRVEPVFTVPYGEIMASPYCRPESDGMALRVATLSRLALFILDNVNHTNPTYSIVKDCLWKSYPSTSPFCPKVHPEGLIKHDLEWILANWTQKMSDVWEDSNQEGQCTRSSSFFWNRVVLSRALRYASKLARRLDGEQDPFAKSLESTAIQIQKTLKNHWSVDKGFIYESVNRMMDGIVILGIGWGTDLEDDVTVPFEPSSKEVISTLEKMDQVFCDLFHVNQVDRDKSVSGILYGRHMNDTWLGGNPSIITTLGLARLYYTVAYRMALSGVQGLSLSVLESWMNFTRSEIDTEQIGWLDVLAFFVQRGDAVMKRVEYHVMSGDYHLPEQLSREDGSPVGANDLSWNFAMVIDSLSSRWKATSQLENGINRACFEETYLSFWTSLDLQSFRSAIEVDWFVLNGSRQMNVSGILHLCTSSFSFLDLGTYCSPNQTIASSLTSILGFGDRGSSSEACGFAGSMNKQSFDVGSDDSITFSFGNDLRVVLNCNAKGISSATLHCVGESLHSSLTCWYRSPEPCTKARITRVVIPVSVFLGICTICSLVFGCSMSCYCIRKVKAKRRQVELLGRRSGSIQDEEGSGLLVTEKTSLLIQSRVGKRVAASARLDERFVEVDRETPVLGKGSFGIVRRATLTLGTFSYAVAVKTMILTDFFENEIEKLIAIDCPYTVKCYGYYIKEDVATCVLEFCNGGDLRSYLQRHHSRLSDPEKLGILLDMARGLEYLHSTGILHLDVKPENVLVSEAADGSIVCKWGDFGLSRNAETFVGEDCVEGGTVGYIPPSRTRSFSDDIFAFGISCHEVWSGKQAYAKQRRMHSDPSELTRHIHSNGLRPMFDQSFPPELVRLLESCWSEIPEARPNMKEVCDRFAELIIEVEN